MIWLIWLLTSVPRKHFAARKLWKHCIHMVDTLWQSQVMETNWIHCSKGDTRYRLDTLSTSTLDLLHFIPQLWLSAWGWDHALKLLVNKFLLFVWKHFCWPRSEQSETPERKGNREFKEEFLKRRYAPPANQIVWVLWLMPICLRLLKHGFVTHCKLSSWCLCGSSWAGAWIDGVGRGTCVHLLVAGVCGVK